MDAKALDAAVDNTAIENHDVSKGIHDHGDAEPAAQTKSKRHQWLEKLIPGIENVTVKYVPSTVALRALEMIYFCLVS